jgi:hypothetical protein
MIMGLIAQDDENRYQRQLTAEIARRPKYGTANQNLAAARYFGRDKSVQYAEEGIAQDANQAAAQARSATNSTSSLLSTISAINANSVSARRGIQAQESAMGDQRLQSYVDEFDKRFEQDENMPHQLRIAALREKIKHQQQLQQAGVAYEAQTTSAMLGSVGSMGGGGGK